MQMDFSNYFFVTPYNTITSISILMPGLALPKKTEDNGGIYFLPQGMVTGEDGGP